MFKDESEEELSTNAEYLISPKKFQKVYFQFPPETKALRVKLVLTYMNLGQIHRYLSVYKSLF